MRAAFSLSGATRHAAIALAEGLIVAGIIAALLLALSPIYAPARLISGTDQTYAAKGGNGGGGSSAIWLVDAVSARSGGLGLGDSFTVGYETGRTDQPWGRVLCYANETSVVSDAARASNYWPMIWGRTYSLYEGGPTPQPFVLEASHYWLGGGADCVVDLIKFNSDYTRLQVLASTAFTAVP